MPKMAKAAHNIHFMLVYSVSENHGKSLFKESYIEHRMSQKQKHGYGGTDHTTVNSLYLRGEVHLKLLISQSKFSNLRK